MARAFRDLPRHQALFLAGGCTAYVLAIAAAALISAGMAAKEDARERREAARKTEPRPPDELFRTPEVLLEPVAPNNGARQQLVQLAQKIREKDNQDTDGFVKALIKERSDLQGLPFQMGGACRMEQAAVSSFALAVATTRESLRAEDKTFFGKVDSVDYFFERWNDNDTSSGVAALTQIFGPEKQQRRESLAKHLKAVDHPASTKALAKSAVFDYDYQVRDAAVEGLKNRRRKDYTDVLLAGLHHPWAKAAHNAARAIVRLERKDLVPQLVAFLAEPSPREPFDQDVNGQTVTVVREVVKVNHHRNCLLCHPPAPANSAPGGVFAVVPTPGIPFPSPDSNEPYGGSPGDAMIRADVTYLRQDFSILAAVPNAQPWPEMQRFDFLVRTRVLTADEAKEHLARKQAGAPAVASQNHEAALHALRRLTGKDAGTTAEAWRQALDLPAVQVAKQ